MKSDRTKEMEDVLFRALKETGFTNIDAEHSISGGVVDYYAELDGETTGIEIKQDRSDLERSWHGKNFVFDYNYLFVPTDLIHAAVRFSDQHGDGIGILSFSEVDRHRSPYSMLFCIKKPKKLAMISKSGKPLFYPFQEQDVRPLGESWHNFIC